MKKQALSLAVLVAGTFPTASNALSLGDIRSNSSLNQPLRAKIELLSTSVQEAKQLQVRLAPNSVFSRVGVDRPAFLNSLRFRSATENGKPVIFITSDAPISEPFVNFLLEVSWPQGQLLKEYTVMLDPPVLMQPGTALAGKEAAVRAEPRSSGLVNRPPAPSASPTQIASAQAQQRQRAQQQQQATQQQRAQQQAAQQKQQQAQQRQAAQQRAAAPQQAQPARNSSRTYRVRRGDTLFKVASRLRQSGVNVDQMMMALYRANPGAFINKNINGLKAGAVLRPPSAQAAKSSSRAQARRQVRKQYAEWTKFRSSLAKKTVPQKTIAKRPAKAATNKASTKTAAVKQPDKARLEVLGKTNKASTANGASAGANLGKIEKELALAKESIVSRQRENKELRSRITDLESTLRKKNRVIALRDDQLAKLQNKLSAAPDVQKNAMAPKTTPATQPRQVVPRTAGETAKTGSDIQNQAANAAQAGQNKIVRAQPPATNQLSAAEKRARQLAEDARKQAQDKMAAGKTAVDETVDKAATKSPFADEQEGGTDLMSLLSSPMAWKIGAGALASLLLLWLLSRLFGRRKTKEERISPVADKQAAFDNDDMGLSAADADANQQYAGLEAELDKAEKYDGLDDDPFGTQLTNEEKASHANGIVEAENTEDEDEDEVLMEANVYIAYGLHQQAESELKKALDKYPDRLEYRHKLLENYFASNNRDEFDQQAEAFMETDGSDQNSKMWREIVEWGGKISPDNKLYQQSGDSASGLGVLAAGAAATTAAVGAGAATLLSSDDASADDSSAQLSVGVDAADDEPGLDDFDFDLDELENELGHLESQDDGVSELTDVASAADLHINDDLKLDSAESQLANTVDDSLDFSLDDLAGELSKENGLNTEPGMLDEVAAEIDNLTEVDEPLDFDALLSGSEVEDSIQDALPDVDLPELPEEDGSGLLGGLAAGAVAAAGAATAVVMSGKDKAKDALSGAGDTVSDTLDSGRDQVEQSLDFSVDELSDAGDAIGGDVGSLDDLDLDFDLDATGADGDLDDLDFDLGQMEPEAEVKGQSTDEVAGADNVTNLNLHLDQGSGLRKILPQDTFYAQDEGKAAADVEDEDSWLGDIDDALSFLDMPDEEIDLHEAHISTKLDLARAYLDMGDVEGARSTLEEVMVEGNDDQRREAETLLHETG
uniref:LysM domain-containing protein n=1 Tax=uncultured Thiotrichaceae bacterium TaxID=298394 RepID=A0A6S6TGC4_9GAMM|nr:MAG: Unknown protein [uncultured Thiotrichaceae bacterium]